MKTYEEYKQYKQKMKKEKEKEKEKENNIDNKIKNIFYKNSNTSTSDEISFSQLRELVEEIREEAYRDAQYTKQRIIAKRERKEKEAAGIETDLAKKEDSFFTINLLSTDNFFDEIELMTKREEDYALKIAQSMEEARNEEARKKDNE